MGFAPVLFLVFSFFFSFLRTSVKFVFCFCVFFELGVFIKLSCVCVCGRRGGVFEAFSLLLWERNFFGTFLSVEGHLRIVRRKGNQILQMEGGQFWE